MLGTSCLLRCVVVLEGLFLTFEVDQPWLTRWKFRALLVANMNSSDQRAANRPRMCEPIFRTYVTKAVELSSGVVLVKNWPPPLQHLMLNLDRARRRSVNCHLMS